MDRSEELGVGVQLVREVGGQPVEADELVDLLDLLLVAHPRRVELLDELRDVAEDGRIAARAEHLGVGLGLGLGSGLGLGLRLRLGVRVKGWVQG